MHTHTWLRRKACTNWKTCFARPSLCLQVSACVKQRKRFFGAIPTYVCTRARTHYSSWLLMMLLWKMHKRHDTTTFADVEAYRVDHISTASPTRALVNFPHFLLHQTTWLTQPHRLSPLNEPPWFHQARNKTKSLDRSVSASLCFEVIT